MEEANILIVDDGDRVPQHARNLLLSAGFRVHHVSTAEDALRKTIDHLPDLIVISAALADSQGLQLCYSLKNDPYTCRTPVLLVADEGQGDDVLTGADMGAEDHIFTPFSPWSLLVRVKIVLRGHGGKHTAGESPITRGDLWISTLGREVFVKGTPVALSRTQYDILVLLARRPGLVYTREQIIGNVKGPDYPVTARSVDVHIVTLRRKLRELGRCIVTERGVGYGFKQLQGP